MLSSLCLNIAASSPVHHPCLIFVLIIVNLMYVEGREDVVSHNSQWKQGNIRNQEQQIKMLVVKQLNAKSVPAYRNVILLF